jgi:hypothetical protein
MTETTESHGGTEKRRFLLEESSPLLRCSVLTRSLRNLRSLST